MRHYKIPLLVVILAAIICGASYFKFSKIPAKAVETMGSATSSKVIVIDPGHGGFDPGKPGIHGEDEKHLNLRIALKLRDYLEQSGAIVVMTRTTDNDVDGMEGVKHKSKDMVERKKMAAGGDIVVSIHHNSFSQPSVKGAQTFYSKKSEAGKSLASLIQRSIKENADTTNKREAKSNNNYYVLKAIEIPAVIVECGFLTNPEEEVNLNDDIYQDKIAWSIYLGVVRYFENKKQ
ncbi:N-acetylmuramoyl-L-alanine amidase [Cellulosilyticum ruminicola]|uniref:N-acetylmuramoyl-L-alanine amidase n=1 Tax=Cellulosilyticum ruminicola TaxID=425254 RepID=UPI0006D25B1C|nr:N-acetylmuramoyl-L-alanine amidase [Cellulosilyticum ruminicola]